MLKLFEPAVLAAYPKVPDGFLSPIELPKEQHDALEQRAEHMVREARVEELKSLWDTVNRWSRDSTDSVLVAVVRGEINDRLKTLNTPTGKEVGKEGDPLD